MFDYDDYDEDDYAEDDYDEFDRPYDSIDCLMDDFREKLCDMIRGEMKGEIERQERELEELRDFRDRKEEIEREHAEFLRREKLAINQAEQDAKKARLADLFAQYPLTAWRPHWEYVTPPKCDKCDEQRHIHFFSPSGKECTEDCECAKGKHVYSPTPVELYKIQQSDFDGSTSVRYYRSAGDKGVVYLEDTVYTAPMPKPWTSEDWVYRVFANREDCEAYCKFLTDSEADGC